MSHTAFLSPSLEVMLERLASLDEGDCIGKTSGNFQKARMAKTVLKDKLRKAQWFVFKRKPTDDKLQQYGDTHYVQYELWTGFTEDEFKSAVDGRGQWDPADSDSIVRQASLTCPDPHHLQKHSFNLALTLQGQNSGDQAKDLVQWYTVSMLQLVQQPFVARIHEINDAYFTLMAWSQQSEAATAASLEQSLHPEDVAVVQMQVQQEEAVAEQASQDAAAAAQNSSIPKGQVDAQQQEARRTKDKASKARRTLAKKTKQRQANDRASAAKMAEKTLKISAAPTVLQFETQLDKFKRIKYCQDAANATTCRALTDGIEALLAEVQNILKKQKEQVEQHVEADAGSDAADSGSDAADSSSSSSSSSDSDSDSDSSSDPDSDSDSSSDPDSDQEDVTPAPAPAPALTPAPAPAVVHTITKRNQQPNTVQQIVAALQDKDKCDLFPGGTAQEVRKEVLRGIDGDNPLFYVLQGGQVAGFIKYRNTIQVNKRQDVQYYVEGDAAEATERSMKRPEYVALLGADTESALAEMTLACTHNLVPRTGDSPKPFPALLRAMAEHAQKQGKTHIYLTQSSHDQSAFNDKVRKKYNKVGFRNIQVAIDGSDKTVTDVKKGDQHYEWPLVASVDALLTQK